MTKIILRTVSPSSASASSAALHSVVAGGRNFFAAEPLVLRGPAQHPCCVGRSCRRVSFTCFFFVRFVSPLHALSMYVCVCVCVNSYRVFVSTKHINFTPLARFIDGVISDWSAKEKWTGIEESRRDLPAVFCCFALSCWECTKCNCHYVAQNELCHVNMRFVF